jgi:hypothetical protein
MARRRLKSTSSRHNVAPHTKRFLFSRPWTRFSSRDVDTFFGFFFLVILALTFVFFFVLSPWFLQTPRVA